MSIGFLEKQLMEFLNRRTAPRAIADDRSVQLAEIKGLSRILEKYTGPNQAEWWSLVEAELDENSTTRAWPVGGELKAACIAVNASLGRGQSRPAGVGSGYRPDTAEINAKRINAGAAVAESALKGNMRQEMINRGLTTEQQLAKYRI